MAVACGLDQVSVIPVKQELPSSACRHLLPRSGRRVCAARPSTICAARPSADRSLLPLAGEGAGRRM